MLLLEMNVMQFSARFHPQFHNIRSYGRVVYQ